MTTELLRELQNRSLLIDIDGPLSFTGSAERVAARGQFKLHLGGGGEPVGVQLSRFALFSAGPAHERDRVGKIVATTSTGEGTASSAKAGVAVALTFPVDMALQVLRDGPMLQRGAYSGQLVGVIDVAITGDEGTRLAFAYGELVLEPAESSAVGLLGSITVDLTGCTVVPLGAGPPAEELVVVIEALLPPAAAQSLTLLPIQFNLNGTLTGSLWPQQLAAAQKVWGKCCLQVLPAASGMITLGPQFSGSTDAQELLLALPGPPPANAIPVFFVDNALTGDGGGLVPVTLAGSGADVIILTSNSGWNLTLLAHELGHSLRGEHPGTMSNGRWTADAGTVLEPSVHHQPCPSCNTAYNCVKAYNPLLLSMTGGICVMQPDQVPC